jgi:hypothetical protein
MDIVVQPPQKWRHQPQKVLLSRLLHNYRRLAFIYSGLSQFCNNSSVACSLHFISRSSAGDLEMLRPSPPYYVAPSLDLASH